MLTDRRPILLANARLIDPSRDFDGPGDKDRESLDVLMRVSFSCESLRVTTRLMHVIAWLLTRRAVTRGELTEGGPGRVTGENLAGEEYDQAEKPQRQDHEAEAPQKERCHRWPP